jgi:hypothetical protein
VRQDEDAACADLLWLRTSSNTEATIASVLRQGQRRRRRDLAAPAYICAQVSDIERFFLDVADATDPCRSASTTTRRA